MKGIVKTIVDGTDFGFIRGEDQFEYFFHRADTDSDAEFAALQKGDHVEFDVMVPQPRKGPRAEHVVALSKAEEVKSA